MKTICPECNHSFDPSDDLPKKTKACRFCDYPFKPKKSDQRFCRNRCRYQYHNQEKAHAKKKQT